jgi:hypothetical protein
MKEPIDSKHLIWTRMPNMIINPAGINPKAGEERIARTRSSSGSGSSLVPLLTEYFSQEGGVAVLRVFG